MSSYIKRGLLGFVVFGLEFPVNMAYSAPEAVEPWVYDSILQLAAEGYLELPENSLGTYSRKELSDMVAQALNEMEKRRSGSIVDEYARISRLVVMDEVQLKIFEEQAQKAHALYNSAHDKAAREAEIYLRRSMNGQNRLEVMGPTKEKHDIAQDRYEIAAHDYAEAVSRVDQRRKLLAYAKQKQQTLFYNMSGGETNKNRAIPPNPYVSSGTPAQVYSNAVPDNAMPDNGVPYNGMPNNGAPYNGMSNNGVPYSGMPNNGVPYNGMPNNGVYNGANYSMNDSALDNAGRLRAEFLTELEEGGETDTYNARQQLSSHIPVNDIPDQKFKLDTELRVDSRHSDGEHGDGNRTRVRARLYPDYDIDGNWHAKGMVEAEKFISGENNDDDAHVRLDRYYLSGNIGTVHTDAGVFGNVMAEGNIYDSKYKGIRLSTTDTPVRYTFEYGNLGYDTMKRSFDFLASYKGPDYSVDAGYYNFKYDNNITQHIYMGSYKHNVGIFDLGGMVLYGKQNNLSGKTGYVLSLSYQPVDSWRPYTFQSWLKYYYQPAATYVSHTMNGMADRMRTHGGFKGFGIGVTYNLPDAWAVGLEFYSLSDLDYGHRSNTIWGYISKSFKNYTE